MSLRSWVRKLFRPRRGTTISKVRPRALLGVELLEDRLAPATIVVNTLSDAATDAVITNDTITLREAINHENAIGGGDTITFAPSIAGQVIKLTNGQLTISQDVTIGQIGGTTVTISGNFASRVFDVTSGNVQINNVTIEDGVANDGNGGAILNRGDLTLTESTVTGSKAVGNNGGSSATFGNEGAGGGIYNYGGATLNLVQSTISGNTAQGGRGGHSLDGGGAGGGGAGMGGAIFSSGAVDIVDSTISGNAAIGGAGGNGYGRAPSAATGHGANGGGSGGSGGASSSSTLGREGGNGSFGGGGGGGGAYALFGIGSPGGVGGTGGFGGGGGGGAYTGTGLLDNNGPYYGRSAGGLPGAYGGQGSPGGNTGSGGLGGTGYGYSGNGGGGAGIGGGVFSLGGGLTITASTIADNAATGGFGGPGGSTVTGQNPGSSGYGVAGGVFVYTGSANLDSTIIADNTAAGGRAPYSDLVPGAGSYMSPDARGTLSGSFNLVKDTDGVSGLSSSQNPELRQNPNLSALAKNGGPTQTMAIGPGPALQAGDPNLTNPIDGDPLTVDQRGVPRRSPPDIGAYQVIAGSTITVTAGGPVTLGSGQNLTASATLSAGIDPTGTITFTLYDPSGIQVDTEADVVIGNGSYSTPTGYTLPAGTVTGTYQWNVEYSGDTDDLGATDNNDPNGQVIVSAASPVLAASALPTSTILGGTPTVLNDAAALVGAYNATGTITFTLDLNGNQVATRQVTVNGDGQYTAQYNLPASSTVVGAYQWNVSYSGDGNNNEVDDDNDAGQQVQVSAANPTLTATPSQSQVTLGSSPVTLADTAVLEGAYNPTGTITFTLDQGSKQIYSTQVAVSGDGPYSAGFRLPTESTVTGAYQWNVSYGGDGNNGVVADDDDVNEQLTIVKASPTLSADPVPAAVTLGPAPVTLTDAAALSGGYHETGTVSISGNPTKPYDGTTAATLTSANFQVNGLGSGDGFTITKTAGAYNSKNVASATTVTVSLAKTDFSAAPGTLVGDYTFPASASGPGQITPVTLTVAIVGDPTKTYDGATAATLTAANYQLSGVIKGEGFTVKQTVGTYNSKDVATASNVTASLAATNFTPTSLSGTLASNYAFPASATGAGLIRRATLTYHIGNDAQDEGIPVNLANGLPATFNTGVNGENLALSYSSLGDTAAALPGKYAIAGVIANGTGLASDYAVALFPGTLTVNPPLRITTTTLPSCFINVPYATTVSTTGGTGPLTFTLTAGSLPTGLKLNANGTIKGIPTVGGTFTFTITATDAFGEESNLSLTLTCSVAMHPGQWN